MKSISLTSSYIGGTVAIFRKLSENVVISYFNNDYYAEFRYFSTSREELERIRKNILLKENVRGRKIE